ncbi:RNA-directed DNA polymerase (Reverse transcriptase) [Aspergillus udagawae]|nr:RNA-directed DNA polymerase (Reverse transcriptase) [Aspergillus udagawae]
MKEGKKPGSVKFNLVEKLAFRRLIAAFQAAPLLRHFDSALPIRIETDASKDGMAGILSQPDEQGTWHPIAFWSRKFTGAELNWAIPDKELFAIVHSFNHWRQYTEGAMHQIEVLSDHANLQGFMKQPKLNGRQARWLISLMPFDFVIKHQKGKANPADAPTRRYGNQTMLQSDNDDIIAPIHRRMVAVQSLRTEGQDDYKLEPGDALLELCNCEDHLQQEVICQDDLRRLTNDHSTPRALIECATQKENVYEHETTEDLKSFIKRIQTEDIEAQRRIAAVKQDATGQKYWNIDSEDLLRFKGKLFVPNAERLRNRLISIYHDEPLAGHFGRNRTEALLRQKFHWTNLQNDVESYIKECPICQGTAAPRHRPYGKLNSLPQPSRPFSELSMDFITGLPTVLYGTNPVDSILVIVDRFSKWSLFFPVSTTITAAELAELFHREVELKFGPPNGIISDRGPVFTSKFWGKLCYITKIKQRLSTAFHAQTDGQTERMNQVLERYLRCFVNEEQNNWATLLREAEFAMNRATNASLSKSPFEILLGYNPDFHIRAEDGTTGGEIPAVTARVQKLSDLRERLKEQWRKASETQAKHYNKHHKELTLEKGQLVGLSTKNLKLKVPSKKLAPTFIGPFRVLGAVGSQAYRLALPTKYDRIHNVFHVSYLEPWNRAKHDQSLPMPELEDDDEWEVEEVKDNRIIRNEQYYLVKWKDWPSEYNQWVHTDDMTNAQEAIQKYKKRIATINRRKGAGKA